jgi:hypothetical protein
VEITEEQLKLVLSQFLRPTSGNLRVDGTLWVAAQVFELGY